MHVCSQTVKWVKSKFYVSNNTSINKMRIISSIERNPPNPTPAANVTCNVTCCWEQHIVVTCHVTCRYWHWNHLYKMLPPPRLLYFSLYNPSHQTSPHRWYNLQWQQTRAMCAAHSQRSTLCACCTCWREWRAHSKCLHSISVLPNARYHVVEWRARHI